MASSPLRNIQHLSQKDFNRSVMGAFGANPVGTLVHLKRASVSFSGEPPPSVTPDQADIFMHKIHGVCSSLQNSAILYYNDDADINWRMGRFLHRAGKPLDSLGFFEKVIESRPEDTYALARYAEALVDAYHDSHDVTHATKALALAEKAHELEGSDFTSELVERVSNFSAEKMHIKVGPAYQAFVEADGAKAVIN